MRYASLGLNQTTIFARLEGQTAVPLDRPPWDPAAKETGAGRPFEESELCCPVAPSKIVCVGRNYAAHAMELGNDIPAEPLLFLKPPSSLLGPDKTVVLPEQSERVEHEAELGVVIGKRARKVSREAALGVVFGYTCVCDVTARDLQRKDGQWTRAKGFDTFCPVGPWIETELDPKSLAVVCRVNGDARQNGNTSQMIFDVATLVSYISHVMTLEPGDLIATGTPEGVGLIRPRDAVEVEVERIGVLRMRVA